MAPPRLGSVSSWDSAHFAKACLWDQLQTFWSCWRFSIVPFVRIKICWILASSGCCPPYPQLSVHSPFAMSSCLTRASAYLFWLSTQLLLRRIWKSSFCWDCYWFSAQILLQREYLLSERQVFATFESALMNQYSLLHQRCFSNVDSHWDSNSCWG